jgi:hypothetical protein
VATLWREPAGHESKQGLSPALVSYIALDARSEKFRPVRHFKAGEPKHLEGKMYVVSDERSDKDASIGAAHSSSDDGDSMRGIRKTWSGRPDLNR